MRWVLLLLASTLSRLFAPLERSAGPTTPVPPPPPGTLPIYLLNGAALHPVYRPRGPATPEHSLRLLLAGLTAADRAASLQTALPPGARLLSVARRDDETLVDVSDAGPPEGVPQAAAQIAATLSPFPEVRAVRVCVRGRAVRAVLRAQFLHPTPFPSLRAASPARALPGGGLTEAGVAAPVPGPPLAGKVIVVSPGHGMTRFSNGEWRFQRPHYGGVVEDRLNTLFAIQASRELRRLGATVHSTRALEMTAEPGASGAPRWQEAAKYYLRDTGMPDWVHQPLAMDFGSDIDARPLYANYRGADLLVSLHNNIGPASGTLTLYDTANGYARESRRLARLLHGHIAGAIRESVSSGWRAMGARGTSGRYGENHWAHMPSAIVEVGFYNRRWDRARLTRPEFQTAVGRAVAAAVCEYFTGSASSWAGPVLPDRAAPVVSTRPAQPSAVVCLGDPAGSPDAAYVAGLRAHVDAGRGVSPRLVRPRTSPRTIEDALAAWEREVAPHRPSFVLMAFGCRDLARRASGGSLVPVEHFEAALAEGVRRTRAMGAIPVLATIGPIDSRRYYAAHPRGRYAGIPDGVQGLRDAYNAAIRRVAYRTCTPLADVSRAAWRHERDWLAPADGPASPGSTLTPAANRRVAELLSQAMAQTHGPWGGTGD